MATFFMFGKYSKESLEGVSSARTKEAEHLIARFQGTIKDMYVLLGEKDLVLIVDLPGVEEALKASASLSKLTGIAFSTLPAIPVNDFDIFSQVEE